MKQIQFGSFSHFLGVQRFGLLLFRCFVPPGEGNSQLGSCLGHRQCHLSAETLRTVPRHCSLLVELLVHFGPCLGTNPLFSDLRRAGLSLQVLPPLTRLKLQ